MCVPYPVAVFLMAVLMVLLKTNMDAKFVNVQVSVLGSRKDTALGSTQAQKKGGSEISDFKMNVD